MISSATGRASQQIVTALRTYLHQQQQESAREASTALTSTLESVRGEWNVVYWDAAGRVLAFGRDLFGRKSLCWRITETESDSGGARLELTAFPGELVSTGGWKELHPGTLFILRPAAKGDYNELRVDFHVNTRLPESLREREEGSPAQLMDASATLPSGFTSRMEMTVRSYYSLRELQEANEGLLNQFTIVRHQQFGSWEQFFEIRGPLGEY